MITETDKKIKRKHPAHSVNTLFQCTYVSQSKPFFRPQIEPLPPTGEFSSGGRIWKLGLSGLIYSFDSLIFPSGYQPSESRPEMASLTLGLSDFRSRMPIWRSYSPAGMSDGTVTASS